MIHCKAARRSNALRALFERLGLGYSGRVTGKTVRGRGRPRTGTKPFMTGKGYAFRATFTVEGEAVKRTVHLETFDLAVANIRRRKALEADAPPDAAKGERASTLAEFGDEWIKKREARNIAMAPYERGLWEHVWRPGLGKREIKSLRKPDFQTILDDCAAGRIKPKPRKNRKAKPKPYGHQSLVHLRAVMVRMLGDAQRDELIDVNRAELTTIPEVERDGRPRAVLTDDEIAALVACKDVDGEIKLLVLLSRTVGGMRAGDLNALDWEAFGPGFATLTFVRSKTRKKRPLPETHAVPKGVIGWVKAWHEHHESPERGPVFPVRKGPRAGEQKAGGRTSHSYASKLRKALLLAGVDRRELHKETPTTRPVDFHSTRRAYGTAVADASSTSLQAASLIGHSSPVMTQRYLDATRVRVLPGAAVPTLPRPRPILDRRRVQNQGGSK